MKSRFYPLFIVLFLITACSTDKKQVLFGYTQGTTYNITYVGTPSETLQSSIDSLLNVIDMSLSTYKENSLISRINRNETDSTDVHFRKVFSISQDISALSNGAFDATVKPLLDHFGFDENKSKKIDSQEVSKVLEIVGYQKVRLNENRIQKDRSEMKFNFNAIAQGYTVDCVAELLESKGIQNYMVEIGGELRTKGLTNKNLSWKIAINEPLEGDSIAQIAVVKMHDLSLATSGNYRNYHVVDGIKYVHTIDPVLGKPVMQDMISASVFSKDCITADALATAFMVMGYSRSVEFLEKHPEYDGFLICSAENGKYAYYISEGIREHLTILETKGE